MEPRAIAAIVEKIARSPLSVSAYFKRHKLPFGRSRYFQYKAQLAAHGLDGLVDGRSRGNRREVTAKDVTARGSSREPITAGPKSARNALPPWRTSAKAKTTRAWRCSRAASSFWSASVWAFWPCR